MLSSWMMYFTFENICVKAQKEREPREKLNILPLFPLKVHTHNDSHKKLSPGEQIL